MCFVFGCSAFYSFSFYSFLEESKYQINDICQFITGSWTLPIHGFENKIIVQFLHSCKEKCGCLPTVSTCALTITLPIHIENIDKMIKIMDTAITESPFFGRV